MSAFNLNDLSAADAEVPTVSRRNKVSDSPFPGFLRDSYDRQVGKAVTVRADQVGEVQYAIRQSAQMLGLGSRIVLTDKSGTILTWISDRENGSAVCRGTVDKDTQEETFTRVPDNTNVTVTFQAKDKRARRTRAEIDGEATDTDAPADEYTEDNAEDGPAEY